MSGIKKVEEGGIEFSQPAVSPFQGQVIILFVGNQVIMTLQHYYVFENKGTARIVYSMIVPSFLGWIRFCYNVAMSHLSRVPFPDK